MRIVLCVMAFYLVMVSAEVCAEDNLNSAVASTEVEACFIRTLTAIQDAIRWPRKSGKTKNGYNIEVPAWSSEKGEQIGRAFIDSAQRHGFKPGFLAAIGMNESDLRDQAVRESKTAGGLVAKDAGLMAVRCVLSNKKGWWVGTRAVSFRQPGAKFRQACVNSPVRGMTLEEIMVPELNIEIAATKLAQIRDTLSCPHLRHFWLQHYNQGTFAAETGVARHYTHRVAVLYHAMAEAMGVTAPEFEGMRFAQRKGEKARRIDKPVGDRQRRLFGLILTCTGHCDRYALR